MKRETEKRRTEKWTNRRSGEDRQYVMNNPQPTSKFWHKLTIAVKPPLTEIIASTLFEFGAEGIEEVSDVIIAYFSTEKDIEHIGRKCQKQLEFANQALAINEVFNIQIDKVYPEDWQENWKAFFKPIAIDSRMVITPSWETIQPKPGQIVITIDPQQAFGTGGHETTRLMLNAMLEFLRPGMRVLDAGTGSGILAIAAAKLGASFTTGFDIDEVAVQTAKTNAVLNEVKSILFFVSDQANFKIGMKTFDLILANMLSSKLLLLIPQLVPFLEPNRGRFILSGFLIEEKTEVTGILKQNGLLVIQGKSKNEWLSFICRVEK